MARGGETWVSVDLEAALRVLSAQQANGVLRIVKAELEGRSISSLLDCPGQICTSTTYYGSGTTNRGWKHKPQFLDALELARRDYRKWLLEHGVGDALAILAASAPEAARALRQEVAGDPAAIAALTELLRSEDSAVRLGATEQLGNVGLPDSVPALAAALGSESDPEVRAALVAALGKVAAPRNGDRQSVAFGVLDRADVRTAAKQAMAIGAEDLDALIERELARLASRGEAADATAAPDDTVAGGEPGDEAGPGPAGVDAEA
jgi:hypothetical protein